jgi:hypothetical protein
VDVECIKRAFDLGRRLKVMYRKQAQYSLSVRVKYGFFNIISVNLISLRNSILKMLITNTAFYL